MRACRCRASCSPGGTGLGAQQLLAGTQPGAGTRQLAGSRPGPAGTAARTCHLLHKMLQVSVPVALSGWKRSQECSHTCNRRRGRIWSLPIARWRAVAGRLVRRRRVRLSICCCRIPTCCTKCKTPSEDCSTMQEGNTSMPLHAPLLEPGGAPNEASTWRCCSSRWVCARRRVSIAWVCCRHMLLLLLLLLRRGWSACIGR